jgi:lipid-A-disaccharide synthase
VRPILVCCGEASGDLLAGGVVRAIKARDPSRPIIGIGGVHCRAAGAETLWDVSELSVMGIGEVIPKLRHILKLMDAIVAWAARERPEVALLVDAPDFNLRLAKRLKRLGVRVIAYVSPSVWAWRQGRVKTIAKRVDELCCILPFEESWYRDRGVRATFVGHPLLEQQPADEAVRALRHDLLGGSNGPLLALLPGSRRFEVKQLLPAMLGAARQLSTELPTLRVAIPVAPTVRREVVEAYCRAAGVTPMLLEGHARELLGAADAAIVASGTASLEAALARVPTVVTYRASFLTYLVFKLLVRAPFIALPNIIAGRQIVPEVLQRNVTSEVLASQVRPLLRSTPERAAMVDALTRVRASLGTPGASERVAASVLGLLLPSPPIAALPAREQAGERVI